MAYVVADPCVKCKYTDCVAVCPVDCFYEGKNSLAIKVERPLEYLLVTPPGRVRDGGATSVP
jgi:NAD-dependent dihydropyrimidine dehydrogenase PreA subunit